MNSFRLNWFYILIGIMFVSMIIISSLYFKGSRNSVVGIAESKAYKIAAEKPAVVKAIHVVPGKEVKKGDLLVELTSHELEIDIAKLQNRIAVLQSEKNESVKLAASEIALIKAQQGVDLEELESDINEVNSEIKLNDELTRKFVRENDSSLNPAQQRIQSLRQQKLKRQQAMNIKIDDVLQETKTAEIQLSNQIKLLQEELNLMLSERIKLSKYASADGVVENIYVRSEEQIDAYSDVLSINPLRPITVVAYKINKKFHIQVGDSVMVSSLEGPSDFIRGKVIGFGSVKELPVILQKSTATKAFGQEIFIEISDGNNFANGEKVLVK